MALALAAIWFSARRASERQSYGYYRLEIFAAIANAALLLGIAALVVVESLRRFAQEPEIRTGPMLVIALIALLGNLISALLVHRSAALSLNMRAAYLEVVADALGSAAVILAAAIIALTGFHGADALASGFIGLLIVPRTWSLLREAIDILLESTPKGVQMQHVRRHILETPGVHGLHDLHVWTITSGMNVISAHVVVSDEVDNASVLSELSRCLSDDFDIEHSTFQLETAGHRHAARSTHV
jgi:cobalt-zinc-cadmium efflux system protein